MPSRKTRSTNYSSDTGEALQIALDKLKSDAVQPVDDEIVEKITRLEKKFNSENAKLEEKLKKVSAAVAALQATVDKLYRRTSNFARKKRSGKN